MTDISTPREGSVVPDFQIVFNNEDIEYTDLSWKSTGAVFLDDNGQKKNTISFHSFFSILERKDSWILLSFASDLPNLQSKLQQLLQGHNLKLVFITTNKDDLDLPLEDNTSILYDTTGNVTRRFCMNQSSDSEVLLETDNQIPTASYLINHDGYISKCYLLTRYFNLQQAEDQFEQFLLKSNDILNQSSSKKQQRLRSSSRTDSTLRYSSNNHRNLRENKYSVYTATNNSDQDDFSFVKREMSAEERLNLNWWQKWRRFRRIPWKLIVHVLLAILTTIQVFVNVNYDVPYRNNARAAWNRAFIPGTMNNLRPDMALGGGEYQLFTMEECMDSLHYAVQNYFDLPKTSIDRFYIEDSAELTITAYKDNNIYGSKEPNFDTHTISYAVNASDPYGPFNSNITVNGTNEGLRSFFDTLHSMQLRFFIVGYDITGGIRITYDWEIYLNYHFIPRGGRAKLFLNANVIGVHTAQRTAILTNRLLFVEVLIVVLAALSLILITRTIYRAWLSSRTIQKKRKFDDEQAPLEPNSFHDEQKPDYHVFKGWFILIFIGNICSIIGSLWTFGEKLSFLDPLVFTSILNGLGCSFMWFSLVRYLESFQTYYILVIALQQGLPNVTRLVVCAMPIVLGYTFFGMIAFGEYSTNFDSFDHSFAALFSTVNGDNLYARYLSVATHSNYAFIIRIYEYSFVMVACYAVINIFIAIIQESYNNTKKVTDEKNQIKALLQKNASKSALNNKDIVLQDFSSNNNNNSDNTDVHSVTISRHDLEVLLTSLKEAKDQVKSLENQFTVTNNHIRAIELLLSNKISKV